MLVCKTFVYLQGTKSISSENVTFIQALTKWSILHWHTYRIFHMQALYNHRILNFFLFCHWERKATEWIRFDKMVKSHCNVIIKEETYRYAGRYID